MPGGSRSAKNVGTPKVELLYFDGCPSYEKLLPRLRALLAEEGCGEALSLTDRFLGSPTVRLDGEDVDPSAAARGDFGLKCRLYPGEGRLEHLPPEEWIRTALERSEQRG